ncbi:sodium:calcium antiporter [Candidatus Saccharibacteria bacterium]|nr:sodium:calcium antiporter [Candidatus Saccharibacteria bacterium]
MILYVLLLAAALAGVIKSASWFLKAVEIVGHRFNLPAFILGVVLVGFGTSLPELATSIGSVAGGTHNVTIANVIGSNMANVLLVVGVSTFFLGTIKFRKNLIDLDLPHLFCVSVLFAILIADGNLSLADGIVLLIGFLLYLLYSLTHASPGLGGGLFKIVKGLFDRPKNRSKKRAGSEHNLVLVFLGMAASVVVLALSSRLVVVGLLEIADRIDLAVDVVTFVTIAIGTSLPELLVTFKALKKGQGDLVLGNIIGSSVFNILLVGGLVSVIHTQFIDASILLWSIVGLLTAAFVAILNGITKEIHIWEGAVFIMIYIAIISKIVA